MILGFHDDKVAEHGSPITGAKEHTGWGIKQTAEALKLSTATISYDLRLGRALKVSPERFILAKSRNHGIEILHRDDSVKVEIKFAKAFISGSLLQVVQINEFDHYLIKLDKPIKTDVLDIDTICLPNYYCRTYRP